MNKLEQAARQVQIAISDAVNALLFLAHDCEMRNSAVEIGNKAITALREALEQLNCQCGDKCFPIFSGDIEYCETCGKPTALAEQVHTPYCKQAPMCKTPCGNSDCVEQAEQEPVHESLQIAAVALQDIACSSQTNNLLWWQIRAREAQKQIAERLTNSAPAEPVKQEPVASVRWGRYKECEWTAAERLHELLGRYREGQTPLQLYAAPVRTKDLTDYKIDCIRFNLESGKNWNDFARAVIAADRKLNGVEK